MAQDNRPEIVLDGDISPFRQKMREAGEALKNFGREGENAFGRMTGPLGQLQQRFVAIGAVLAGGAVFKQAVADAAKFTEESTKLGRALGVSASEASILRTALQQGNTSQEEFTAAAKGLLKQVKENEEGLNAMGLKTRDAAGNLRPLNDMTLDAIEVLNGYRAGTDRVIAGHALFGKGFEMTTNLARMNKQAVAETAEQMQRLGMVASTESVAAWEAFDDAGDKAVTTLDALKQTIGNAVIPVLTELGNWFSAIGPAAVVVLRGAVGGLMAVFWGLYNAVNIVWSTLNAMATSVSAPLMALSSAMGKALKGDFAGAAADLKAVPGQITDAWTTAFDEIVASSEKTRDKLSNLFMPGTASAAEKSDGKSADGLLKPEKKKKEKEESMLPKWEAELAAMKDAFEQENVLRQFSKQQELDFWRAKLATAESGSKDYLALAKKVSTLSLEIRRQEAKDALDLEQVKDDGRRRSALFAIEQEEQAARFARENGAITKLEMLKLEEDFLRRRFEIEQAAQQERLALIENDPTQSPAALERARQAMLEIEERYKLRKGENKQQQGKEEGSWGNFFDGVSGSFGNAIQGMLTKAQTLRQGLLQIFNGIREAFLQNVVVKPFTDWLTTQLKMLAVKRTLTAEEMALEQANVMHGMVLSAQESSVKLGNEAPVVGAKSAEAVANIPYVGPILAAAAFAAGIAMVLGARGGIKSASRGFDIPKGLNPMTQLHEEEMVLPAKYANMFRSMEEGGMGQGGGGQPIINITAMDAKSVSDYFKTNSHALAPGLRKMARNFTSVKKS